MGLWDGTDVPTREQFDYWQDVICREFVPLSAVKTDEITGFASKVETSALGSLNRASIMSKAQITRRSSREIAVSDHAYFFVNLQLAGQCLARVGGTCSVVAPGDFMVVDTTEPYEFEFKGDWRMLSFRVQHASLAHRLAAFRSRLGTSIGSTGAGAAVTSLMTSLSSLPDDLPPASAEALVQAFESAVIGTLAAAPGPAGDSIGTTPLRAAVMEFVRRNYGDPGLGVDLVSRAFSISPRTLHTLFEGTGISFAKMVRQLRLQHAFDVLSDPSCSLSVTELARICGFYDPSSFSRAFRRHFDVSPLELRRARAAQTA